MITLRTIQVGEPKLGLLTSLKQYAAVPDSTRDALLTSLLKMALQKVQETANETVIPSVLEVTVSEREDNAPVVLYQGVSEIVSVKNGHGDTLPYKQNGRQVTPDYFSDTVVVRYKTEPDAGVIERLTPVVLQYATALFDGETTDTLNRLLQQC